MNLCNNLTSLEVGLISFCHLLICSFSFYLLKFKIFFLDRDHPDPLDLQEMLVAQDSLVPVESQDSLDLLDNLDLLDQLDPLESVETKETMDNL